MSSLCRSVSFSSRGTSVPRNVTILCLTVCLSAAAGPLRVCSDPNNLPFSNQHQQGFENKIAELIAHDLNEKLEYTWWQQRRNYVRNTLQSRRCDLLIGMPAQSDEVAPTTPYYTSTYAFVYRKDRNLNIRSLDDPALHRLRIGLHVVDDTYTPPAAALARRGIRNFAGYSLFGAAGEPNPPAKILDAVAGNEIDVAIVWGPLAGYFAKKSSVPLAVVPFSQPRDGVVPFRFAMSAAVRKGDSTRREQINAALQRHKREIRDILNAYGVPLVDGGNQQ